MKTHATEQKQEKLSNVINSSYDVELLHAPKIKRRNEAILDKNPLILLRSTH
ncbi:MAG: hypothetical protein K2P53_01895 [Rickettsiales bacterium]|nr:hypothetical protein [Rickettsiales bacterium]